MSIRATSLRPNISSPTFNSPSTARISKTSSPRSQPPAHRTTSQRGTHRSRHQSPSAPPSPAPPPSASDPFDHKLQLDGGTSRMVDQDHIAPLPASPTPQKAGGSSKRTNVRRRQPRKAAANSDQRTSTAGNIDSADDEDALFNILGVSSERVGAATDDSEEQPRKSTGGILAITRAEIDGGKTRAMWTNKKPSIEPEPEYQPPNPRFKTAVSIPPGGESISEGEGKKRSRVRIKRSNQNEADPKHQKDPAVSDLSASRPKSLKVQNTPSNATNARVTQNEDAFDTASLSQSLPAEGLFTATRERADKARRKGKKDAGGEDESSVWEMPAQAESTTSQALTWQQKLQSSNGSASDSPRRSVKSGQSSGTPSTSDRKLRSRGGQSAAAHPPSAFANSPATRNGLPRPSHARRVSADNLPISAFDDTLPFHTGMNVNRAPQTPAKLHTSKAPGITLPLIPGEFPRIGKQSLGPASIVPAIAPAGAATPLSMKYAGPTFHNSPHAASLPKPDLDDF